MGEKSIAGGRTSRLKKYFRSKQYHDIIQNKNETETLKHIYEHMDDYLVDLDVVSLHPTAMLVNIPPIIRNGDVLKESKPYSNIWIMGNMRRFRCF